jgi:hypothetical protein
MTYLNKVLDYKKSTFSQLDGTYLPALDQLLNEQKDEKEEWLNEFKEVVGSIVVLESPLSITLLACLLQISREEVKCQLNSLHSVLSIPNSKHVLIRLLHSSFCEFLIVTTQARQEIRIWRGLAQRHMGVHGRTVT